MGFATRRHEPARVDDLQRQLVALLDGTRDRAALVDEMARRAAAGGLTLRCDHEPVSDPAEVRAALAAIVDQALGHLARQAILVA